MIVCHELDNDRHPIPTFSLPRRCLHGNCAWLNVNAWIYTIRQKIYFFLNTSELWTSILQRLPPVALTVSEFTPNLSVSSVDCVTSVNETVWRPILIIGIFHCIACHRYTASDSIPCVSLSCIAFSNLQGQRFVSCRRPFWTPLPTRRCKAPSSCSFIRIIFSSTSVIVPLVTTTETITNA